ARNRRARPEAVPPGTAPARGRIAHPSRARGEGRRGGRRPDAPSYQAPRRLASAPPRAAAAALTRVRGALSWLRAGQAPPLLGRVGQVGRPPVLARGEGAHRHGHRVRGRPGRSHAVATRTARRAHREDGGESLPGDRVRGRPRVPGGGERHGGDHPRRPALREGRRVTAIPALLVTTVVGSYPQPDWLIDRERLGARLPPRVRARELWRVPEPLLEQAQDDATRLAVQDQERA